MLDFVQDEKFRDIRKKRFHEETNLRKPTQCRIAHE